MTTTTTRPNTFDAYMAEVSGHVSALLDSALSVDDIADYRYRDAHDDGVPARDCALDAIEADDLASGLYAELHRVPTPPKQPAPPATSETTELELRPLADILKGHRPSVRNFAGNVSAPDEYITDGRILLLSEHIRTAGRVKKYRDRTPEQSKFAHVYGRVHRSIEYKAIKQVIPDFSNFVYADYFGYATPPSGGAMVFKVRDTREYILIDADLYAIVSDVYSNAPSEYVLVNPDNLSGPAIYHPYHYKRAVFGLIMPVRGKVEHPQLSN
jgi:hypothetical protein